MRRQQALPLGIATTLVISVLGGCVGGPPTAISEALAATATPVPSTLEPPTAIAVPPTATAEPTMTTEQTATLEPAPAPPEASNQPFLMRIEEVFAIKGRGTVVTGRVARGTLQKGDEVEILGPQNEVRRTIVTGIEMFNKALDQATAGDNVGILLRGIELDEVMPGMVLAQAMSFASYAEALRQLESQIDN